MINQNTLQGDVLDILFANRNKLYGAYLLRRTYPDRLKRSLGIMLALMVLLSGWMVWREHRLRVAPPLTAPPLHITKVDLIKDPPPIEHPVVRTAVPHAPAIPHIAAPPMQMAAPTPPRLVDDPQKPLPDISTLVDKPIGVEMKGPAGASVAPGTGVVNGPAKGIGDGPVDAVFDPVEKMPEFPGGEEALRRFFMRYLQTPDELEAGGKVKVMIRFVVGKDGSLSAYAVQQSGGQVFDDEVVRVLKKMPKWSPGIQNGKPVAVYFSLPVTFVRGDD